MFLISELYKKNHQQKSFWAALLLAIIGLVLLFQMNNPDAHNFEKSKQEWQVLLNKKETIHLHWLRTLNPFIKNTDGDLVWNNDLQKGLMRFVDLPKLKGSQYYHLWIYDLHQSQEKPVLAGVFNPVKRQSDEFYAPITPQQPVQQPYKFLLTMGKKGDKIFSRSQSLLLAQP